MQIQPDKHTAFYFAIEMQSEANKSVLTRLKSLAEKDCNSHIAANVKTQNIRAQQKTGTPFGIPAILFIQLFSLN